MADQTEIGKIELNFQVVDTGDPKMLVIHDFSKWRVIKNMPSFVEITLPGSRKPIVSHYEKNTTNGFNSLSLGVSCHVDCEENLADLPDGIYEICVKGGKDGQRQKLKFFLKKDKFQLEFDSVVTKLKKEYSIYDDNFIKDLARIKMLMEAASASARKGEIAEADDYFKSANNLLERHLDCKNCL